MHLINRSKILFLIVSALLFAACSGGGSSTPTPPPGPTNAAPAANAGADQTVDELTAAVSLDASGSSDPDAGDVLTYAWTQTAGATLTITNADTVQASFDAPDVLATATPVVLTFQVSVSDGTATINDTVDITVNDVGLGANSPPLAIAGVDQTVSELVTVNLDGSGSSDPNNDTLSYAWLQTAGPSVTLSDANIAQPDFTSPDVLPTTPETLTFQLIVNDGTDSAMDSVNVDVAEGLSEVTIAGAVTFEFVNPNANCSGLNFNNIDVRPIRAATVQLIDDATGGVLATMVSGDDGTYSFPTIAANTAVRIRVRAELKRAGAPNWDVEVRDNVDTSGSPPPLGLRPLYVVDFQTFSSGVANISDADFTATTGWGGSSYTGNRAAAPFAILDAMYSGIQLVLTASPTATFAPLDVFWSVNNTPVSPTDIDAGELSTSFYRGDLDSLFLLGDAGADTEEFDDHVSMHEWGHYFEDTFSRSDSIGGSHMIGGTIDARLAFGEGWATALAAMALDNPQYCDTGPPGSSGGFGIDTEGENGGPQGFYNEMSVATLIYDLWDTDVDGADNSSIGFGPIFEVMTGPQALTDAHTTLFSFGAELRARVSGADLTFVEAQLARENIDLPGLNIYGDTQTTQPGGARDVIPVYTDLPTDGTIINICTNSDFDAGRNGNRLSEHRFLRFTTLASSAYEVNIVPNPVPPPTTDPVPTPPDVIRDRSDPDIFIYRDGQLVAIGNSGDDDLENFTTQVLPADTYAVDLQEFRYADEDGASSDFPEQVCFDVSMTPQ